MSGDLQLDNLDLGERFPAAFVSGPFVLEPERVGWSTADFERLKSLIEQHFGPAALAPKSTAFIWGSPMAEGLPVFLDPTVPLDALDFVHPDGSRQRFTLPVPGGSGLDPWDGAP